MPSDRDLGVLDPQQWQRLNELVGQFEKACAASDNVELESFLPAAADVLRPYVLEELIKSDLDQRWRKGIPAHLETYVQKYPELGTLAALAPQLIFEEYWVRKRHGDRPDLESYRERFPAQFDKLKLMVQETGRPSLTGDEEEEGAHGLAARLKEGADLPVGDGFKLVRRLGSGNFGQVWEALTPGGKPVAVKVLNWPMNHPAAQREHQSLELIKKLNHPYLLDVMAFYTQDEALVIVTRLADGNLKDRLKDCKRQGQRGLPPDELLRYLAETAEVLDYLNTQNIQHRDIKPENLLLSQGHVAVGDLGLARLVESQQVQASVLGTPPYMAPEVWLGKIHPSTDQYSLAITYVELRRGRCPFTTANINGLTADDLKDSPELEPLREAEKAVLLRAGSVNPDQRFASCTEFVEALKRTTLSALEAPAYRKIRRIGKGAFGEVWRGEAPGGIAVAIKVIPRGGGDKSQSEAEALELIKQLTHPYLVKTYACWDEDGELHIAMELADRSLADRINECRKEGLAGIPRDELLSYIRNAAEGLDYLHSRRVLHRDIKPENILLQGNFAKVADFGVARLIADQHLFTATTSGTMAYMPPEAWRGKYSVTSDQYSLAVTYGEMRLGHRLFTGDSPAETMEAHLHRQPPLAKLPEAEQRVLLKGLAKSPDERYPTCKAFVEALEKAAAATIGATSLPAPGSAINRTMVPGSDFSAGPESRTEHEVAPIGGARPGWRSAAAPTPKTDPDVDVPAAKPGWKSAAAPTPTEFDVPKAIASASPRKPVRADSKRGKLALLLLPLLALTVLGVLAAYYFWPPGGGGEPQTIQVAFTSLPSGATLFLNGQPHESRTDTTLALKPGKYLVRMEKAKYKPFEKVIEIKASEPAPTVHFPLEEEISSPPPPTKYNLTVHSKPDKAKVYIDGKLNSATTDNMSKFKLVQEAGTYDLKLVLDAEHYVFHTKVTLPGTDLVSHEFEPITVTVKTMPSGAKVTIGGKDAKEHKNGEYFIAAGQHTIEVSMDGYHTASKIVQISDEVPHPPLEFSLIELPRHQFALLVGVNYAGPDLPWFLHAEPDVEELSRTLLAAGYAKDKVAALTRTRAAGGKSPLPNRQNILTTLTNLANKCKKKDTLVVALVGHQIQFNDGPKGNFFCPADSQLILDNTLVSMDEVYDILGKCEAATKVVLLDGWQHTWQEKGIKIPGGIERKRGPEKYPEGVSVFYACSEGGSSYDHRMVRHGVFFYFVNRGLQGEADGVGGPKDGVITLKELDDYLSKQVPSYVAQTYKKQQKEQEPKAALPSGSGSHKLLELTKGLKLFNDGYVFLEKKDYDSAIKSFDAAEKEAKDFAEIYFRRGHAWFLKDQGNSDKLISDCKLALQFDPSCATAHGFLAEGLRKQNNLADAIDHHDKAVVLEPQYALGLYSRAVTFTLWAAEKEEKLAEAIKDLENANLYNPHLKEARFWLGQIYAANEDYGKAAAELKIAVDLDPDWKEARDELDKVKKMIKQEK